MISIKNGKDRLLAAGHPGSNFATFSARRSFQRSAFREVDSF